MACNQESSLIGALTQLCGLGRFSCSVTSCSTTIDLQESNQACSEGGASLLEASSLAGVILLRGQRRAKVTKPPVLHSGVNSCSFQYHWAFLIGPKVEKAAPGTRRRCHVKNQPNPNGPGSVWQYEEVQLQNVQNTTSLLVHVMIWKVENLARSYHYPSEHPCHSERSGLEMPLLVRKCLSSYRGRWQGRGDFSVGLAADRTGCEVVRWTKDCSGSLCDLGAPDKTQANLGFAGEQRNDIVNIVEIVIHPFVGCHYAVLSLYEKRYCSVREGVICGMSIGCFYLCSCQNSPHHF